jgi:hypothetical protein
VQGPRESLRSSTARGRNREPEANVATARRLGAQDHETAFAVPKRIAHRARIATGSLL